PHNPRRAANTHRAAETDFTGGRRRGRTGGGRGPASFLPGAAPGYRRYVSTSTDARERQWRWFWYIQDTWRAGTKWTFNYGIRLEDIVPQTVNNPGNAGFFDLTTGEMKVAGVGGIAVDRDIKDKINFAPRLRI